MNASNPIHLHPLLGEISELLHRMTKSKDEALAWHAWDVIAKLRKYEEKVCAQTASEHGKGK